MKNAVAILLTLVAIIFSASCAQAMSCSRPSPFTIGMCSKMQCSQTFSVEYQWTETECRRREIIKETDPEMIKTLLHLSDKLSEKEQLVLFVYYGGCQKVGLPSKMTLPPSRREYGEYTSTQGAMCGIENLKTILLATHVPSIMELGHRIPGLEDLAGKSFGEIQSFYSSKIQRDRILHVLLVYMFPVIMAPALSLLILFWVRNIISSGRSLLFKIPIMVLPVALHLGVIVLLLMHTISVRTIYGYMSLGAILFTLALYPWLAISLIKNRRKESHESV